MRKRMPYWLELKWLIASYVFDLLIWMTAREASHEMVIAIHYLATNFDNDEKFKTVPMRAVG